MALQGIAAPERVSLGENSKLLVGNHPGGIWIRFIQGVIDMSAAEGDATDNMSGGFTEPTRGPRTCRISADCYYRTKDNPLGNFPKFDIGELTGRLLFWPDYNNDANQVYWLPIGQCNGFTITAAGTADVRFSLALRNFGTFYYPARPSPVPLVI